MNEEITRYNLSLIANRLRQTAVDIPETPALTDVKISLRNQALHLASYQENLVDPMTRQTLEMMQLTTKLDESFKFNRSSFEKGIESILLEIEEAQKFINNTANLFVREVSTFHMQINRDFHFQNC